MLSRAGSGCGRRCQSELSVGGRGDLAGTAGVVAELKPFVKAKERCEEADLESVEGGPWAW